MPHIQAVFYGNPDRYPPILNGIHLLCEHGFTIDLFCPDTYEEQTSTLPSTCRVLRSGKLSAKSWQDYPAFVRRVVASADATADLFLGHDMHGFLPARIMASRYRRPLVYQAHELVIKSDRLAIGGRAVFAFQKQFAKTADLVITPDHDRASIMKDELRLSTLPLVAANAPLLRPNADSGRLLQAIAEQNRHIDPIILRQGNIGPGHAVEATIRSMPHWIGPLSGLVLLGPLQPDYAQHLQGCAEEMGVHDRLVFLPPVPYHQVMQFTVDAHIGHALYEAVDDNNRLSGTASNKLLEYMAAGLPLLASNRPGLRALIERYDCGLTADESDPASIAAAVNTLLGDSQRARQMGVNAARAFDQEFRYDRQFAPVLAALTELASGRRS